MEAKVFITNNKVVLPVKEKTFKERPELYIGWRRASVAEIEKAGHILVPIQEERKPKKKAEE
jgi:hypothetical protein